MAPRYGNERGWRPFLEIATSDKTLPVFPGWSQGERETTYSFFEAPLDLGGVTQQGLVLKGGCFLAHPDKNVSFELFARNVSAKRRIPLMRVDWKAISGGHSNIRVRPDGLPARVSETHHHAFELNYSMKTGRMRGANLPLAAECSQRLDDFEALCAYVGRAFRINNMNIVSRPDWDYKLV